MSYDRPYPMNQYPALRGTILRLVDGEYRLGFQQSGEWIDLGRAVIRMTSHREETGAYTMEWVRARDDDSSSE